MSLGALTLNTTMNLLLHKDPTVRQAVLDMLGIPACIVEVEDDVYTLVALNSLCKTYFNFQTDATSIALTVENVRKVTGNTRVEIKTIIQRITGNFAQCFNTGEILRTENEMVRFDGRLTWARNVIMPLTLDGVVVCLLVTITDITALIQTQEALESNLLKLVGAHVNLCEGCRKVQLNTDQWVSIDEFMSQRSDITFSHGICPNCSERVF